MENLVFKLSSTEGYFGIGTYDKNKNYELYNQEHYFKSLKIQIQKNKFIKKKAAKYLDL